jgi:hypothetical protein
MVWLAHGGDDIPVVLREKFRTRLADTGGTAGDEDSFLRAIFCSMTFNFYKIYHAHVPCQVKAHVKSHCADLTMARIARLSGAANFSQAVTTWDKSGPNATEVCESLCVSPFGFPNKAGIFRRFKSCRSDYFSVPSAEKFTHVWQL